MATKRVSYEFENVIEREEYHDGKYGAPGKKREEKKKATPEQVAKINQYNREKKARHRLSMYFHEGDWFATLTYRKDARPADMATAKKHFSDFMRNVRPWYRKQGYEVFWIRNIENTKTNNWHIHLVINDIPVGNLIAMLNAMWPHGRVHDPKPLYKRGEFKDLATYITKNEKSTRELIGDNLDHQVTEASYSHSRNMPLPPPKVEKLKRWEKQPREKKGWYIDKESYYEGINPVTGYKYRHYTLIRINRRIKKREGKRRDESEICSKK
ncbi:hypothetical protein AALD22_24065 [Lachnospiraceae bacterium 56-18]